MEGAVPKIIESGIVVMGAFGVCWKMYMHFSNELDKKDKIIESKDLEIKAIREKREEDQKEQITIMVSTQSILKSVVSDTRQLAPAIKTAIKEELNQMKTFISDRMKTRM